MNDEYELPWMTSHSVLALVFIGFLVTFHIFFVFLPWIRFTKIAWKKADYFYLSIGALGLLWGVTTNRLEYTHNVEHLAATRFQFAYSAFRNSLAENGIPDVACSQFQRGEYSPREPEFTRIQNQYSDACNWLRKYSSSLPRSIPPDEEIGGLLTRWQHRPVFSDPSLNQDLQLGDFLAKNLERTRTDYANLQARRKPSDLEEAMHILAPFLLACALALRITKVTGELRLENASSRAKPA
jgi:hypothetical protein